MAANSYANYFGRQYDTMVSRAQWLSQGRLEPYFHELLENGALGLARLLFHEAADQDAGMGPAQRAVVMLELAAKHPEILASLMIELRWSPALLADLALYPPTAGLACLWIAKWSPPRGGWDQGLETADDQTGKATAFADAVWLFGEFLKQGKTDPAEAADLLIWFHDNARAGYLGDTAKTLLASLRDILAQQSAEVANHIVAALVVRLAQTEDIGGAPFASILDMVSLCRLEDITDPAPILSAYKAAIDKSDYNLSARGIGTLSATALYRLAKRSSGEAEFLYPDRCQTALGRRQSPKGQ